MKRIFLSFLVFLVGSFLVQTKAISYSSDPESFISEVIDEAKVILSSSSSSEEKADKLSQIALKIVDIKGLAYYTLGKKRKELTPEQLKVRRLVRKIFFKKLYFKINRLF